MMTILKTFLKNILEFLLKNKEFILILLLLIFYYFEFYNKKPIENSIKIERINENQSFRFEILDSLNKELNSIKIEEKNIKALLIKSQFNLNKLNEQRIKEVDKLDKISIDSTIMLLRDRYFKISN